MKRPKLSKSPPLAEPREPEPHEPPVGEEGKLDPTRYGDWERKGIAIDF